jgi:hypothetical protein
MPPEKTPVIRKAYRKLRVMSEDEANRMPCEARLKAQRDEYSRIQGAWQEGPMLVNEYASYPVRDIPVAEQNHV